MNDCCEGGDAALLKDMMRVMMAHHFSLRVAVTALLRTHPNPAEALEHFDRAAQGLGVALLNSDWSEDRLSAVEQDLAGLRQELSRGVIP